MNVFWRGAFFSVTSIRHTLLGNKKLKLERTGKYRQRISARVAKTRFRNRSLSLLSFIAHARTQPYLVMVCFVCCESALRLPPDWLGLVVTHTAKNHSLKLSATESYLGHSKRIFVRARSWIIIIIFFLRLAETSRLLSIRVFDETIRWETRLLLHISPAKWKWDGKTACLLRIYLKMLQCIKHNTACRLFSTSFTSFHLLPFSFAHFLSPPFDRAEPAASLLPQSGAVVRRLGSLW